MAGTNLERSMRFLEALSRGAGPDEMAAWFSPDVVQIEYPNLFLPKGARRDLSALQEASRRGRAVMASQEYEVIDALADGDRVALRVRWLGRLGQAVGPLEAGAEMRANFALFMTFRDGLIVEQHNYDCFDPW